MTKKEDFNMTETQFRRGDLRWGTHPEDYGLDVLQVLHDGMWYNAPNYIARATDDERKLAEMQRWALDHNIILV